MMTDCEHPFVVPYKSGEYIRFNCKVCNEILKYLPGEEPVLDEYDFSALQVGMETINEAFKRTTFTVEQFAQTMKELYKSYAKAETIEVKQVGFSTPVHHATISMEQRTTDPFDIDDFFKLYWSQSKKEFTDLRHFGTDAFFRIAHNKYPDIRDIAFSDTNNSAGSPCVMVSFIDDTKQIIVLDEE